MKKYSPRRVHSRSIVIGFAFAGPGLFNFEAKGVDSNPKAANGLFVPKKFSNISCAFCLYVYPAEVSK
jgi:hypothetical protein